MLLGAYTVVPLQKTFTSKLSSIRVRTIASEYQSSMWSCGECVLQQIFLGMC